MTSVEPYTPLPYRYDTSRTWQSTPPTFTVRTLCCDSSGSEPALAVDAHRGSEAAETAAAMAAAARGRGRARMIEDLLVIGW
jgi:hypothetical protein